MGKVFDVMKDEGKERVLDIHDYLVKNPASTFFFKMDNEGPEGSDIKLGDVLVVDRSLVPKRGNIIVATKEGEFAVEIYSNENEEEKILWGVVIGLLRKY